MVKPLTYRVTIVLGTKGAGRTGMSPSETGREVIQAEPGLVLGGECKVGGSAI